MCPHCLFTLHKSVNSLNTCKNMDNFKLSVKHADEFGFNSSGVVPEMNQSVSQYVFNTTIK